MIKLASTVAVTASLMVPPIAATVDVPDALSVEWQGKKPCEKLHEDDQMRILRCTFPPGAKHVRHQHPANFVYALSGGKLNTESASGTKRRWAQMPMCSTSPFLGMKLLIQAIRQRGSSLSR